MVVFTQASWLKKSIGVVAMLGVCLSQTACIQSQTVAGTLYESEDFAAQAINENTIKLVNKTFYNNFFGGDWYYQGAQETKGSIDAYIQIPNKLDMSKAAQENYLKKSICPSANETELWQELKDVSLSVHIYTFSKRYSVHTQCDNPLA